MKIAKKEDFALIFMSAMSKHVREEYISLVQVAKESNLSPLFLKHIASALLQKGLLESKEGIGGGYRLKKDPKKIVLADIISAISKNIIAPACEKSGHCRIKAKNKKCSCRSLWNDVNRNLIDYLSKITLYDFAKI